jgi:Zn-dependent peptidase ImmA (M78 family)
MMDDFKVTPRSAKNIEALTLAWRDALGAPNDWAPNMLRLLEIELPKLPKLGQFALITRSDLEMGDAEAYTQFNPPHIVVRNSVYRSARKADGRSRMTLAHELGHLVMHPGAAKLRSDFPRSETERLKPFEGAEWQANKFASLFLMPLHIVRGFTSAPQLAESCQVSLQAAQIRFSEFESAKRLPDCITETTNHLTRI